MRFLPLFFDLAHGVVVLVGAGPAAVNKLRLLYSARATIRWYPGEETERAEAELAGVPATASGRVEVCAGDPCMADLSGIVAIVSATGDGIDERIASRARACHVPVNVVDRPDLSTFIFPAIVDRGDVIVAIGTGGASPVLARRLRQRIEALLPARIGELAALMRRFRSTARACRSAETLRRFWEQVVDGPIGGAVLAGRRSEAVSALTHAIAHREERSHGIVYLVGAGPGDPDLLTLRALQALQNADIIFYDELVTPEILDRARRDAERVFVGRRAGRPGIGQDAINRRLAAAAREGLNVVRLKSGDPFIFGRGGEELEYLREAGIEVFVVPGVTAALGCAADAGLPLSFRNEATQVTFVSAQHASVEAETPWSTCAHPGSTVVVYMGLGKAAAVRDELIAAGRDPSTPAAVLARGTRADSEYRTGRLDEIAALAAQVGDGPALLVVGETVARCEPWRAAQSGARREIAA